MHQCVIKLGNPTSDSSDVPPFMYSSVGRRDLMRNASLCCDPDASLRSQQQQRERELRKHEREQRRRYEEMEQLRREEERRHAEREQVGASSCGASERRRTLTGLPLN